MEAESTLDERLEPLRKAIEAINGLDTKQATASPEQIKLILVSLTAVAGSFAESFIRLAAAAEDAAKAAANMAETVRIREMRR